VSLQVPLSVGNQLCNLVLVFGFHRLGFFQLRCQLCANGFLFLCSIDAVAFEVVKFTLDVKDLIGTVFPQGIDLLLNSADIIINRLAEL